MTPLALERAVAPARSERRFRRAPLAIKLAIAFLGLVAFVLIVNGAIDTYLTYNQAKRAALEVESEKARGAAERVGGFLSEIQTELGWTTGIEWGYSKPEQQRYDFIRLLRQTPAITALSYIDGHGKEQLAVSRLEPDAIASEKDLSADPRFQRAVADKVWFGPVEFRRGSEPYMTIALAHVGKTPGVTVADVNLKLIWDVINEIHVGANGFAYVVDDRGRLIAHPDLSLVLRDSDFSHLPQVEAALARERAPETGAPQIGTAEAARSLDGAAVLTAYAIAPKTRWVVFVEQPLAEALATAYGTLARALALLGLGLVLAAVSGVALARRIAAPIGKLQAGVEKLGAGDLAQRLDIRTGDEIEALAGGFNQMAGQLQESYENLEAKIEARTKDLNEALAQQTATAEVLKVISRSAFDLQSVLDTLVSSASQLCGVTSGLIFLKKGDALHLCAAVNTSADPIVEELRRNPQRAGRGSIAARVLLTGQVQNAADVQNDPEYDAKLKQAIQVRALLGVPLKRNDEVVGAFVMRRNEPGLFDARHVELVETFADQAVIAVENARLFEEVQARTAELEESLARQTATADVLKIISRSIEDAAPVFETILESCQRLFDPYGAAIYLVDGDMAKGVARRGFEGQGHWGADRMPLAGSSTGQAIAERRAVQFGDLADKPDLPEQFKTVLRETGGMTVLYAPMLSGERGVGSLVVTRRPKKPFTETEIDFVQTFADQAVIAIENARLFEEVQARTKDLTEALQLQTATADVLKSISRSAFDLDAVLDTLISTAVRLCSASFGQIFRRHGDVYRHAAGTNNDPAYLQHERNVEIRAGRGTLIGRVALENRAVSVSDAWSDPEYAEKDAARTGNVRAMLGVPLLRDGAPIGAFALARSAAVPFTEREIDLVITFADQAVIAIQNAQLFEEVQARTRDLTEALQMQTATSDVLKVISRSAFDLQTVFNTLVTSAVELGGAMTGTICVHDGDVYRYRDTVGAEFTSALAEYLKDHPAVPGRSSIAGRVLLSGKVERIPDCLADPEYVVPIGALAANVRSLLGVPLLRKDGIEGAIILTRAEPGDFSERQIEIVQTFADQAVIALENVRLFEQVQARTRELTASLSDLRKAQDRLVQSEKLASLGQLTAGIAHEIKNPLNFVNNFAALSRELLEELRESLQRLPEDAKAEADDLMGMIDSNLEKVASHGKRADSIVKNMLLHSREGSGERSRVNVNAMVEEALNLGYHGARAEKPGFNVTIEKVLDPDAGEADLYLQEVTRVLLNLISNGFYASAKRKQDGGPDYEPTLKAATRSLGRSVEIRIRDNGTGIPDQVRAKMFNPFFTTKPAGEGTGLGLSLSHDIVVKQHGGTLDVETLPGAFTEFVITLPREGAGT